MNNTTRSQIVENAFAEFKTKWAYRGDEMDSKDVLMTIASHLSDFQHRVDSSPMPTRDKLKQEMDILKEFIFDAMGAMP